MVYRGKRLKINLLLIFLIAITIYFISIYYMTSKNSIDLTSDYKDLASLPADFVYQCQLVEKSSKIPWELFAAYYQINIEEKLISKYPKQDTLFRLSRILQSKKVKSINELVKIKIKDEKLVNKIYARYKLLKQHSYLFSDKYTLPIVSDKLFFTDTWGEDRDNGERAHLGTDLFAPKGTPVYAVTSGTIEKIGWIQLGGQRIGLRGKDGLYYYYAHLKDFAPGLKKGDEIFVGKLIGYVGNTGNAINTPYHLHFGIEIDDDQWINPYNFLSYWKEK